MSEETWAKLADAFRAFGNALAVAKRRLRIRRMHTMYRRRRR